MTTIYDNTRTLRGRDPVEVAKLLAAAGTPAVLLICATLTYPSLFELYHSALQMDL